MESTELSEDSVSGFNVSQMYNASNASDSDGLPAEYQYFRDMSRFWVKSVLYPLIMCVGVLGNSVTIVVLTRRRMRSSTNHYLTALAMSDMFYLIFHFTLNLNHFNAFNTYTFQSYWCYAIMLTDACSNTSVWLTVTFTIERYVAVCHPIRGKVLCTRSRAKKVIACVVLFCFTVVIPTPFEHIVVEVVEKDDFNRTFTSYGVDTSALGSHQTYKYVYYLFTSITFVFMPLSLLALFNTFLIRSVHHSKTQRRRMTMRGPKKLDNAHQEQRITIMLIAVVIMFLICQSPTAGMLVYMSVSTVSEKDDAYAVIQGLGNIFNFLVAINAACNFILYCAFSDRYRRTFLRTFIPCLFRRGSPNHSQTNLTAAFTNVCQASETESGASCRRQSAGAEHNSSSQRKRRPMAKNKLSVNVKNGHFNCYQMSTLAEPVKSELTTGHDTIKDHASTLEANGHGHQVANTPKSNPILLDNGYLSTQDDNGSDTTQETVVSNTDADVSHASDQKKRPTGVNCGSDETANL